MTQSNPRMEYSEVIIKEIERRQALLMGDHSGAMELKHFSRGSWHEWATLGALKKWLAERLERDEIFNK